MATTTKDLTIGLTRIRVYCAPNAPGFASAARIFFFVHGGCFWDGDETYNEAQSMALAQRFDAIVVQIGFDQRNGTKKAVYDLHSIYDWLLTHAGSREAERDAFVDKLCLVGVSSGAFFAALLMGAAPTVQFRTHVFLAPVFNPFERHRLFTRRRHGAASDSVSDGAVVAKQLDHFLHNVDAMRDYSNEAKKVLCERFHADRGRDRPIFVFYGADDKNVPVTLRAMQTSVGQFTMTAVFSGVGHEIAHRADIEAFELILRVI